MAEYRNTTRRDFWVNVYQGINETSFYLPQRTLDEVYVYMHEYLEKHAIETLTYEISLYQDPLISVSRE